MLCCNTHILVHVLLQYHFRVTCFPCIVDPIPRRELIDNNFVYKGVKHVALQDKMELELPVLDKAAILDA